MPIIAPKTFVIKFIMDTDIRNKFNPGLLLDFYQFCLSTNSNKFRFKQVMDIIADIDNLKGYTESFKIALFNKYASYSQQKDAEIRHSNAKDGFMADARNYYYYTIEGDRDDYIDIPHKYINDIMSVYNKTLRTFDSDSEKLEDFIESIWDKQLNDNKKYIWYRPDYIGNSYTNWISINYTLVHNHVVAYIHKNKSFQIKDRTYTDTDDNNMFRIMGKIWSSINYLFDNAEIYDFNPLYKYIYVPFPDSDKHKAAIHNKNVLIQFLNDNYKL